MSIRCSWFLDRVVHQAGGAEGEEAGAHQRAKGEGRGRGWRWTGRDDRRRTRSPAELIEGDGNGEQPGGVRHVFDLEDVAGGGLHRETKGGYIAGTFSPGW